MIKKLLSLQKLNLIYLPLGALTGMLIIFLYTGEVSINNVVFLSYTIIVYIIWKFK